MEENRLTAVEFLQEQLDHYISQAQKEQTLHLFELAKRMEQDQLDMKYGDGYGEGIYAAYNSRAAK